VIDLEPGRVMTASTGVERCGVAQTGSTGSFCPVGVSAPPAHR
jgi:hypothetical protein